MGQRLPELLEEHRRRIVALVPGASVSLSGSALIDGQSADDVDLVVVVPNVAEAAGKLRRWYPPLYEDEWREDWAAFREPGSPQVDVVVTKLGTKGDDHHRRAWQLLAHDEALLKEYRQMKATHDRYEERKVAFFERLVGLLPRGSGRR